MEKKALAVVSFGTTYLSARGAIERLENKLRVAYPDYDFYRAFTSKMVIRKLQSETGERIDTPEELMERLKAMGYREVLCQSLHVINGLEFEKLRGELLACRSAFQRFLLGRPLLTEQNDFIACAQSMMSRLPELGTEDVLILMGHGTEHFANAAYCQLENTLRYLGHDRVYVATVEGFPGLDYVLGRLENRKVRRVYLTPFMIVAGDHAQNDLAGAEPHSWKSILESRGYETHPILQGLGEYPEIGELFLTHAQQAQPIT